MLLAGGGGGSLHECDTDGITSADHKKRSNKKKEEFSFYYYIFHSLTHEKKSCVVCFVLLPHTFLYGGEIEIDRERD